MVRADDGDGRSAHASGASRVSEDQMEFFKLLKRKEWPQFNFSIIKVFLWLEVSIATHLVY